jgi:hypothetical protein
VLLSFFFLLNDRFLPCPMTRTVLTLWGKQIDPDVGQWIGDGHRCIAHSVSKRRGAKLSQKKTKKATDRSDAHAEQKLTHKNDQASYCAQQHDSCQKEESEKGGEQRRMDEANRQFHLPR